MWRKSLVLAAVCALFLAAAVNGSGEDAAAAKIGALPFYEHYRPVEYKVNPSIEGYKLPLDKAVLEKFADPLRVLKVPPDDEFLRENGFVVSRALLNDDVAKFYKFLQEAELPMLVTTDSVLHLYHTVFDDMLAELEEQRFSASLMRILEEMDKRLVHPAEDAPERMTAARSLARDFLKVAAALLSGGAGKLSGAAAEEVKLIGAASGFSKSPLFHYKEDYSQYVPRGHYTRSETLKRYFKAMMWLGRMTFLLKGGVPDDEALVTPEDADVQTLAAALVAEALTSSPLWKDYEEIYQTTSFLVGYSDDLGPAEYRKALDEATGGKGAEALLGEGMLTKFRVRLVKAAKPAIYSGTGRIFTGDPRILAGDPAPEALAKALAKTAGMRFMGQRFVLDSYFMGKLVAPTVGKFRGTGTPLTGRPYRYLPSVLDVMRLLGSKKAAELLDKTEYSAYKGYEKAMGDLEKEIGKLSPKDWHRNVYLGWLDALRGVMIPKGKGYQPFQRTEVWRLRELLAASGSWAALRHDTILYVKQSYTLGIRGLPKQPPKPKVVVEADPETWARLLALNRQTMRGMEAFGLLAGGIKRRLTLLDGLLSNLLEAATAQLEGREPSEKCKAFLETLPAVMEEIEGKAYPSTVLVADVHTDINTSRVLECGTGRMQSLGAVCVMPGGKLTFAIGPVYTFYEFAQPLSKRLTDEAWRKKLTNNPPAGPSWLSGLYQLPAPLLDNRF
ncbi:MAG: hypothetical protein DRP90_00590 [Planctomycetota bacterium]|nr:MAG: hypothetical protein DRP90_00590 [Planctomycetota bacterium]